MIHLIYLTIIIVFVFFIYWYMKFKYFLPVLNKVDHLEKFYVKFDEFVHSILNIAINFHKDNYVNLLNMIFSKLNLVFPQTRIYILEETGDTFLYLGGVNNSNTLIDFSNLKKFIKSDSDEIIFVEDGEIFDGERERFILLPYKVSSKNIYILTLLDDIEKEVILNYIRFISNFLKFFKNYYEVFEYLNVENKKLKLELESVVREIENQESKLIKKHKQAKIVYDGISNFNLENENPVKKLTELLYNFVEPSYLVYYSFAHFSNSLVLSINLGEKKNFPISINLSEHNNYIVKSFVDNRIIYLEDGDIKDKFFSQVSSLIIIPVGYLKERYGVLVIGGGKKDFFTKDDLSLVDIISKEIGMMIYLFELYKKVSEDAKTLANLNRIKDDFLITLNHEIKTPLTTIKGFVSLLLSEESGSLNDQQISFLNIINQATNRLINIITNLLDISKLNNESSLEFEKINFIEIVENAVILMKIKAYTKSITISFEKNYNELYVLGDKHYLLQALNNLIDNAIKYSPNSSVVNVKVFDRESVVACMVEDFGYGIDEEDKKYIFEKFFRAKNMMLNTEGSGLGLSIAKTIIEKHNGKIWFESQKGKGSRFYFALPKLKLTT
jgi:signal transduction histidine kinase